MIQTSHQAQEAWRACYCFLAAHLAHRLSKFGDDEAAHDLRALLGPILCLDMTLAKVVVVLNDAGVSPAAISAGAARPDHLVKLLRRLQAEQVRLEAKQLEQFGRQSQFSHAIARAADAIGGVAQATS